MELETMKLFRDYLRTSEDVEAKLDEALVLVDRAKGYVGKLRSSSAILIEAIENVETRLALLCHKV
jgi:hypothetical protein